MVFPATTALEITPHLPVKLSAPKEAKPFDQQISALRDKVVKMRSAAKEQLNKIGEKYPEIKNSALEQIQRVAHEYNTQTHNVLTALGFKKEPDKPVGNDVLAPSDAKLSTVVSETDSTLPNVGELLKIRQLGEIERRKAWVKTVNLVSENENQMRGTQLKKGVDDVRLNGPEGMLAGKYFIKEALDNDTDPFDDFDNSIPVESRQLLRFQRLKEGGAKVPGTFRKYVENGKGYFVISDLTHGGKNWVWGVTDKWKYNGIPQRVNIEQIHWDQLTDDLVMNASCATTANVLANTDAHIISGSDGQTSDYLADLDKGTWVYPEEATFFGKEEIEISNLGSAGKALVLFLRDTGQQSKMTESFSLFWAKTKQFYGADRAKVISQELLEKSSLAIGLEESETNIIRNIIKEPDNG